MKVAKAVVAGFAAVVAVLVTVLSDDAITSDEIGQMVAVVAGVLGVYLVPNEPARR